MFLTSDGFMYSNQICMIMLFRNPFEHCNLTTNLHEMSDPAVITMVMH